MNPLNNLRLGHRLALGFAVVLALVSAIAGLSLYSLKQAEAENGQVMAAMAHANAADQWRALTHLNVVRTLGIAKSGNNADVKAYFGPSMKETSAQISTLQKQFELASAAGGRDQAAFADIAGKRKTYITLRDVIFKALDSGDAGAGARVTSDLLPSADVYVASVSEYAATQRAAAASLAADSDRHVDRARATTWLLSALSVGIGVFCAWMITGSVTGPLRRAADIVDVIAKGDLSQHIVSESHDEVSSLLSGIGRMQDSLRMLVGQVRGSTDSIQVASQEVAQGSQNLSVRTEQAAASLQQTASSMEQITSAVKQTSDAAQTADRLVADASHAATTGGQVVSRVTETMDQITRHSNRIADIIGVIDGIAFQTNILALNAAVEAARAGEQGRGFAVVATEVRNLAQRSSVAAKEIRTLIAASAETVETGATLVKNARTSMTDIETAVQRVSEIVGEIRTAASEQADGLSQVTTTVSLLDHSIQQNAALVEQTAAAAESLKDQACLLADTVAVFRMPKGEPRA
jgi:methyl-accepting chemotaxis protein